MTTELLQEQNAKINKYGTWLWMTSFVIMFGVSCLGLIVFNIDVPKINTEMLYLFFSIILTAKAFLLPGYRIREKIVIGIILLIACIVYFSFGMTAPVVLFSFVFAARGIPYRTICMLMLACYSAMLIAVVLLSFAGITDDAVVIRGELWGRGNIRHTFGFCNPNTLGRITMMIVLLAMLVFFRKLKWYSYLILLAFATGVFLLTDSKTAFACSVLAVILVAVAGKTGPGNGGSEKKRMAVAAILFAAYVIAVYVIIAVYDENNGLMYAVNVAVSDRLNLAHWGLETYGVSLFGDPCHFELPVDCLFSAVPIRFGVPVLVAYLATCLFAAMRAAKAGRYDILAAVAVGMIYSVMEYSMIAPFNNIMIFAAVADINYKTGKKSWVNREPTTLSKM